MARAIRAALLLAALALFAALLIPRGAREVTILGDGAPAVRAAYGAGPVPGGLVTEVQVALLRRPENIRHLPEAGTLCRGDCAAALTAVVEPRIGGWRKLVVVQLDAFEGADALDRGEGLPAALADCLARAVAAEAGAIRAAALDCVPARAAIWRLPFGL
ncbi:hypothetical protein [Jannaschia ovalis]|uniref:Uncharacterized protein n=1 Tax=Jannaschia ovalis TaxID=3038773 RepID=A0ABY8LF76_9RHOB|nr:hypothetical protein [Jannaschia sp. GRR-S6-38]WGH79961.1 hypothetical protein P8627_06805 [Jannaschia sp. GRR-S6-38]